MIRIYRLLASLAAVAVLAACGSTAGPSAYEAGLRANVDQYKLFSDGQLAQQQTLQACYQHNPNKSECSILAAGTNATQTLAGQPQALRVAKSQGEIAESLVTRGLDATVKIYGITAVRDAVIANSQALRDTAAAGSASQAEIAQAGIAAASKPPLVVDKPVLVQVPAGSSVVPVPAVGE
jgi:hypothetical protein